MNNKVKILTALLFKTSILVLLCIAIYYQSRILNEIKESRYDPVRVSGGKVGIDFGGPLISPNTSLPVRVVNVPLNVQNRDLGED